MATFVGVFFAGIFLFILVSLPAAKPDYAPDPDKNAQREIARSILRGEKKPEDITADKGYDPEHIKNWVEDFKKAAVALALDVDKYNSAISLQEEDIEWFKSTCKKYIGDDWEQKTGFRQHYVDKYNP